MQLPTMNARHKLKKPNFDYMNNVYGLYIEEMCVFFLHDDFFLVRLILLLCRRMENELRAVAPTELFVSLV
jgi:hypothetical protein